MAPESTKTAVDSDRSSVADQEQKVVANVDQDEISSGEAGANDSPLKLEAQAMVPGESGEDTPENPKWLTGFKLTMLSTAFTIANLMMAIDGSILGM
jgi:hypothetical protein